MIRPPAIVDTNVVVAGLITSSGQSPVARILDAMVRGTFDFVLSEALLGEYLSVLTRPRLLRLHGLQSDEIAALLETLTRNASLFPTPAPGPSAPDPGDQFLWDLLGSRGDLVLITGDQALLQAPAAAGRVLTPAGFVEVFGCGAD